MYIAGIVLYNPELERLICNIDGIISQVDMVCYVDNGSDNIWKIKQTLSAYQNVILYENGMNKGIACALNQLAMYAKSKGAKL